MSVETETIEILTELRVQMAAQVERERSLRVTIDKLTEEVEELGAEVKAMRDMANRWKGGFLVLAGLGGAIGWVLSTWTTAADVVGSVLKSSP